MTLSISGDKWPYVDRLSFALVHMKPIQLIQVEKQIKL